MHRFALARLTALAGALLAGALAAALLWLALLDWWWLPSVREVRVEYRCATPCVLAATPDVGRGFLYLDTITRDLAAGVAVAAVTLPQTTSRVRLELAGGTGAIGAASELSERGLEPLPQAPDRPSIREFPLLRQKLPLALRLGAALAVGLLGGLLLVRDVRTRLGALVSSSLGQRFATPQSLGLTIALLGAAIFVAASAADAVHTIFHRIDNPPYFPISLFDPRALSTRSAVGALLLVVSAYFALADDAERPSTRPWKAIVLGLAGLILTNLLQGWELGFVRPTAGDQTYFSESFAIENPLVYFETYDDRQAELGTHARTHPPGAVLLYYALRLIFRDAGVVSVVLGSLAFVLSTSNVFAVARRFVSPRPAAFAALVFALLPSVQIYFVISLEAVACAVMTLAVRCFTSDRWLTRWLGTSASIAAALLLTFGALFLVPLLLLFELCVERSARRSLVVFGAVAAALLALSAFSGFDWLRSFLVAARLENPEGFWLLANPPSYLFTRLEGLLEVLLFATAPVLAGTLAAFRSSADSTRALRGLCAVALTSWLAMLATGAFKTGETARSCLFVAPFLVLPLAALDEEKPLGVRQRTLLPAVVFAQAAVMQLTGQYYW